MGRVSMTIDQWGYYLTLKISGMAATLWYVAYEI